MAETMIDRAAPHDSLGTTLTSLVRYRTLLRKLVLKDLKLKYRGSALGFLWSLVNPVVMIAVYSLAFRYILRSRTEGFVFLVLLGILAWTFFANAAMMSTGANPKPIRMPARPYDLLNVRRPTTRRPDRR